MSLNLDKIRSDFPILETTVNGKPLVYLDNAATTQKPQSVIDVITDYYTHIQQQYSPREPLPLNHWQRKPMRLDEKPSRPTLMRPTTMK